MLSGPRGETVHPREVCHRRTAGEHCTLVESPFADLSKAPDAHGWGQSKLRFQPANPAISWRLARVFCLQRCCSDRGLLKMMAVLHRCWSADIRVGGAQQHSCVQGQLVCCALASRRLSRRALACMVVMASCTMALPRTPTPDSHEQAAYSPPYSPSEAPAYACNILPNMSTALCFPASCATIVIQLALCTSVMSRVPLEDEQIC